MSKLIEMGKRYRTRCGYEARILATDLPGGAPVAAFISSACDGTVQRYFSSGAWGQNPTPMDLVEVKPKRVVWINFYPNGGRKSHDSREAADEWAVPGRIACIRVEFEEGEGLTDEVSA